MKQDVHVTNLPRGREASNLLHPQQPYLFAGSNAHFPALAHIHRSNHRANTSKCRQGYMKLSFPQINRASQSEKGKPDPGSQRGIERATTVRGAEKCLKRTMYKSSLRRILGDRR